MSNAESPAATRDRVLALYGAGMHERALELVGEALGAHPDDAWLHAMRSDLLGLLGRSDAAVTAGAHAVSLAPDMGYAHRVLADALIDADEPKAAVEAATEAVRLDPTDVAYYTLVRALIGRRWGARAAAKVARTLGQEYPQSVLAPLAMALVAIRRSGIMVRYRWWVVMLLIIATQGSVLVVLAVMWVVNAIRRVPFLQQADNHLRRAFEMDASSTVARLLAAEVLRARYRFVQAVDQQVAVGALNAHLIAASQIVAHAARTVAIASFVAYGVWTVPGFFFHQDLAGEVTGPVVAVAGAALVAQLHRRQSGALPSALRTAFARHPRPLIAVGIVAALVVLTAWAGHAFDTYDRDGSVFAACVATAAFLVTAHAFVRGRRAPY